MVVVFLRSPKPCFRGVFYYIIHFSSLQQLFFNFFLPNSDLSRCSISEFVRRGDLWSPAKCFDFVGKHVIIPQFRHCRLTTMTGRPQVAPTVLYDKQLDKSEFFPCYRSRKMSSVRMVPRESSLPSNSRSIRIIRAMSSPEPPTGSNPLIDSDGQLLLSCSVLSVGPLAGDAVEAPSFLQEGGTGVGLGGNCFPSASEPQHLLRCWYRRFMCYPTFPPNKPPGPKAIPAILVNFASSIARSSFFCRSGAR